MTAKDALKSEIENRTKQLANFKQKLQTKVEEGDEDAQEAMRLLKKVELSLRGADAAVTQGNWPDAFYLFAQACWNLGWSHSRVKIPW